MNLNYLYEDSDIFVVFKPPAIHCVDRPSEIGQVSKLTMATVLATASPALREASEKPEDSGLVHRLDFETSGVLLGAKTRASWTALRAQLKSGKVGKKYLVLLEGELTNSCTLNNWIGTASRRAEKVRVFEVEPRKKQRALTAKSIFAPIQTLQTIPATLCEVLCPIARRHQVRAHAASMGTPLVGDELYGSKVTLIEYGINSAAKFILHAAEIEFEHPVSKKNISIKAQLPVTIPS